jgi:uncharacterized membrane protein YhaH (DUF805 family)
MDFGYILTSTQGRIPRSQWWAGLVVLVVIGVILSLIIGWALGMMTTIGQVALLILQIIFIYPSYALSAKRFQDRNKPGSLALIGIILAILVTLARIAGLSDPLNPTAVDWILNIALLIVGIWYLIELGILRGTVGENSYGPDPLEGRA